MSSTSTSIEWCDATWNPLRGCSRVSEGCRNCYAARVASRFSGEGMPYEGLAHNGKWTGKVQLVEDALRLPLTWKKPKFIFVNSMSDLFHESVPDEWIDRILSVMVAAPQHTFQILTKRAERMRAYISEETRRRNFIAGWFKGNHNRDATSLATELNEWPIPNVWFGVSVEDEPTAGERLPHLLRAPAAIRFVSYEPALAAVDFAPYLPHWGPRIGLDLIIFGGESGPGARPCNVAWARSVIAQCKAAGVACFVKQLGAKPTTDHRTRPPGEDWTWPDGLRDRKGGDMSEWPEDLRVREFPK